MNISPHSVYDNFGLEEILTCMNTQNMHLVIGIQGSTEEMYAVHMNCEDKYDNPVQYCLLGSGCSS